MIEKSISYVDNHPHLQDESSPFPGEHGRNHPRFQESATKHCFIRYKMRDILHDRGQSSPFTGGIIPIYRRATSYCYIDVLLNHPYLRENSIIPVSRIVERQITMRKHPPLQDGSMAKDQSSQNDFDSWG